MYTKFELIPLIKCLVSIFIFNKLYKQFRLIFQHLFCIIEVILNEEGHGNVGPIRKISSVMVV